MSYDHYESAEGVGGIWRATNEWSPAFQNLRLVSSKKGTAFEDFPMPENVPTYAHHTDMRRYLEDFADVHGLSEAIQFSTPVKRIQKKNGEWLVESSQGKRLYKSVVVCSGHHRKPRMPQFEGDFGGEITHARSYWSPDPFSKKRVLVVGIGNSGAGIAEDLCRHAQAVDIAVRSGAWVIPKHIFGIPADQWMGRYQGYLPYRLQGLAFRLLITLSAGNQEKHGVPKPAHHPLQEHPTLSGKILGLVGEGAIGIQPGIERLEGDNVHFENGTCKRYNHIICATGYKLDFPFLPEETLAPDAQGNLPLYRQVVHTSKSGLFFVGLCQAAGALIPLADRQARWVANLLSGKTKLPKPATMRKRIQRDQERRQDRFHDSPRHRLEVGFWEYALQLEKEMTY